MTIATFYDELAPFYHLIFQDWEASIAWQANTLDTIIRSEWGDGISTVLDVSCGIGTQAMGLAKLGYRVHGSDLSPRSVARARREAEERNLDIAYSVADMRQAAEHHQREFDLLVSGDNAIPHLLTDSDILTALKSFYRCLQPKGGCLITVRDYDNEERDGPQLQSYGMRFDRGVKYFLFQTREYHGDTYDIAMYLVQDEGKNRAETRVFRTTYYAIGTQRMRELLQEAGFSSIKLIPDQFYQPVILATKPA